MSLLQPYDMVVPLRLSTRGFVMIRGSSSYRTPSEHAQGSNDTVTVLLMSTCYTDFGGTVLAGPCQLQGGTPLCSAKLDTPVLPWPWCKPCTKACIAGLHGSCL